MNPASAVALPIIKHSVIGPVGGPVGGPISGPISDSSSPKPSAISLRDRFRGAWMGLALVPVALQQVEAAAYHQPFAAALMQTVLPGLLQHHDHWQRRSHWLNRAATTAISAVGRAQVLLAGDQLETCLTGRKRLLEICLDQYEFSSEQRHTYQQSHRVLQQTIVPESYALSLRNMMLGIETADPPMKDASMLLMPTILGLIAGARSGTAALPVLWQMNADGAIASRKQTFAAADRSYEQWAGILP